MILGRPYIFWTSLVATLLVAWCLRSPVAAIDHVVHRYMFVIDITESMGVEDVEEDGRIVTRLVKTKSALRHILQRLHCESEVALSIFTEHRSFLLITPVPICNNFTELDDIIDHLSWDMAWRSQSEVSKGVSSAIRIGAEIPQDTKVVFFTDGHESPPVHPDLRFVIKNGSEERWGLIVGVGGDKLRPIPRFDSTGKKTGYWHAEDVDQVDRFTKAINDGKSMTGVSPNEELTGKEHLSSIKEKHLRRMAKESMFHYHRMDSVEEVADILLDDDLGEVLQSSQDLRPRLLLLALLVFLAGFVLHYLPLTRQMIAKRRVLQ